MGYTHYWTPKKTTAKKFKEFSNVCQKLHDNLPKTTDTAGGYYSDFEIKIGNGQGLLDKNNKPEFTKDYVWFNGVEELAHETFAISLNETDWTFCKTARKPYDLLVCACLLASIDILGYKVSSDGDIDDWKPALKYYNEIVKNTNFTQEKLESHLKKN